MKFIKRKNPYLVKYGYHLTHKKHLNAILANGFKRKLYFQTDNHERWFLNNTLYGGKSPIYFFTNQETFLGKNISPELKHFIKEENYDILLKIDVETFNQLPDIPHFLDSEHFRLKITSDLKNSYIYREIIPPTWSTESKMFGWFFEVRYQPGRIPIKKFIEDNELMTAVIFYTETFCIADNIGPQYIKDVCKI